jgi:hypothetical protein
MLEDKSIYELVMRFNMLMVERDKIDIEYMVKQKQLSKEYMDKRDKIDKEHNEIVTELHRRMPHLKDSEDIKLIKRKERL